MFSFVVCFSLPYIRRAPWPWVIYAGGIGAVLDKGYWEFSLSVVVHVDLWPLFRLFLYISWTSWLYILGMDKIATLVWGSDGIHSFYILLLYHDMLYLSWGYSFEDDGPIFVGARLVIISDILFLLSYCYDYSSLCFYFLLLVFVESVSLTLCRLAGNPSRRIILPFVHNFQRVISIKLSFEINWIKSLYFFYLFKIEILSYQKL